MRSSPLSRSGSSWSRTNNVAPRPRVSPLALLLGAATAVSLPLDLSRGRLQRWMAEPAASPRAPLRDVEGATRAGLATLRLLARLRLPLWKNTCLFRSILRCRLLRLAGRPAVLRIGAARPEGPAGELSLHAWVELDGRAIAEEVGAFTPLRAAGGRA